MKEILFRAKRKNWRELPKEDWWVEGSYHHQTDYYGDPCDKHYIIDGTATDMEGYGEHYEIDPETLCQYTGLTDKNGNRIWENDIVRIENSMDDGIGNIEFYGGMWYVDGEPSNTLYDIIEYDDIVEMEVVGNVFDNPELMKGE